jgi:hypothetical protein
VGQLKKHGRGIVVMHDLHRNTADALPELPRQLKDGGVVPKGQLSTVHQYDEAISQRRAKYFARASSPSPLKESARFGQPI